MNKPSLSVYLSSISEWDAEEIAENANDSEIALNVAAKAEFPYPYMHEDAVRFIEKAKTGYENNQEYHFGIHLRENGELVGAVGIFNIDKESRTCEIGYWIGKNYWGKGYTKEAVSALVEFAFKKVGVDKIYANVFSFNLRSINLLLGLGFRQNPMYKRVINHYMGYAEEVRYELSFDGSQHAN